jgi:hypothetical protein
MRRRCCRIASRRAIAERSLQDKDISLRDKPGGRVAGVAGLHRRGQTGQKFVV